MRAQPASTLDQYSPAPRPEDGFALSSGETGPHLAYAAQLHIDYARNPLVYENVAGRSGSSRVALVSDQVRAHAVASIGLFGFALLYVALPVDLWMRGDTLGDQPTATGLGSGDLLLGGRVSMHHSKRASVAFQLGVTAPTATAGTQGRPGVAGDAGATGHPEVSSEIAAGPLSVLIDVGARWRQDAHFAGTRFTDVLTFGGGVSWPFARRLLRAIFELHGETPMDDVGNRAGSPLEALLGMKLAPGKGFSLGLAGGAGLLRGYGSPAARALVMLGYSSARDGAGPEPVQQEPAASEPMPVYEPQAASVSAAPVIAAPSDRDKDGVEDGEDQCPIAPGPADNAGCPRFLKYDEKSGEIALEQRLRFEGDAKSLRVVNADALDELLALLLVNPEINVRIEGHLSRSGADARKALQVSVLRAAAVAHQLIDKGVLESRLEAFGCGQSRPIVAEKGSQRAKNERVVAYVIKPLPAAGLRSSLGCAQAEIAAPRTEPAPAALPEPELRAPPTPASKPEPKVAPSPAQPAAAPAAALSLVAPAADSMRIDLAAGRIELLKPIRFEASSAELIPRSLDYLNEVAAALRANPALKISIESYVAAETGAQASLALTQQRAKNVQKRLVEQGIAPQRMKAYGCGESRPIAPDNVPWGRKKNDRVELHVLDPAPSTGVHSTEGCIASE